MSYKDPIGSAIKSKMASLNTNLTGFSNNSNSTVTITENNFTSVG